MTYEELKKEDLAYQNYAYLQSLLAITHSVPIKAVLYSNAKTENLIVFKQTSTKTISTRKFTLPKSEMPFFLSSLANDFPKLELIKI